MIPKATQRKPVAKMIVERDGTTVSLVFACQDEYRAIKLYDELTQQAGEGQIRLALMVGAQHAA